MVIPRSQRPYHFDTLASVYGPFFYREGNTTASGQYFDEYYGPRLIGVAHRTLALGRVVAVEIPRQDDAWGAGLRDHGALVWCRVVDRGPYVHGAGETPRIDGRDIDLTMALLRHIQFFDPAIIAFFGEPSEYTEALRWGVRRIRIHVF
tara:strand:- start:40 stop:486 length:447 start_codon:yes stop_codon:yes gene_type:complete